MKRIVSLSCLVPLLMALVGCGGSSWLKSTTSPGSTNASLAGTYVGTLTYSVGGHPSGVINLVIGTDGTVIGTEQAGTASNNPNPVSGTIDSNGNVQLTETETAAGNVATTTVTGTLSATSVTGAIGGILPFQCVNTNGFNSEGTLTFALIQVPGIYSGALTYTASEDPALLGQSGPITLTIDSKGAVIGTEQAATTNMDSVTGTMVMDGLTGAANFTTTDNGTNAIIIGNLSLNPSTGVLSGAVPFTAVNSATQYINNGTLTFKLTKQ